MSLSAHKRDWEELGTMDPLWAIVTKPAQKFRRWDVDEFFVTGERVVYELMDSARSLGYPKGRGLALDFGCGVGRLTRALAGYFEQCYGVDIAESMVAQAQEMNVSVPNCRFYANGRDNLRLFDDDHFDMVNSIIVLQHLPNESLIRSYIGEFVRVVKPDGLIAFQLPSAMPVTARLQAPLRLYRVLRTLGFAEELVYGRLGIAPMRMSYIPEEEVVSVLEVCGARVLDIREDAEAPASFRSRTYFATKDDRGAAGAGAFRYNVGTAR